MEQISYPYWEVILVFGDSVLSLITASPCGSSIKFISLQLLVGVSRTTGYFEGCFAHAPYAERANWEKVCCSCARFGGKQSEKQTAPTILHLDTGWR
jgi:hypothetical protein